MLADPDGTRRFLPADLPYPLVHYGLVVALIVILIALVLSVRGLSREDSRPASCRSGHVGAGIWAANACIRSGEVIGSSSTILPATRR